MLPATARKTSFRNSLWAKLALIPFGLGIGLLLGWLLILAWDGMHPGPRRITREDHEALLRMLDYDFSPRGLYKFDETTGYRFKAEYEGYRHQSGELPHITNSAGLLGKKEIDPSPAVRKILFLGDSVTYGDGVAIEEVFVSRMQVSAGMSFQLFNGACPGWNMRQEIGFYRKHLREFDWKAVVLVVCLNDFVGFRWGWTSGGGYQWVMDNSNSTFARPELAGIRGRFRGSEPENLLRFHDDATMFAWSSSRVSRTLQDVLIPFLREADRPPLILVLLPTRYQLEAVSLGASETLALQPQQQVAAFCRKNGVKCIDAVDGWRELERPKPSLLFRPGDALHFSEEGHRFVSESLWSRLLQELARLDRKHHEKNR